MSNNKMIKILLIGDDSAKKVQLLTTFINGKYPNDYCPTLFENTTKQLILNGIPLKLDLADVAGFEQLDSIRTSFYANVDVVILCYSVNNIDSFKNISRKWFPELKLYAPNVPYILVATRIEKRNNKSNSLITTRSGRDLAKQIKASTFIECSAKENKNIIKVFGEAAKLIVPSPDKVEKENFMILMIVIMILYSVMLILIPK